MSDKKLTFHVSTSKQGSAVTETFLLKGDLNIDFDNLTSVELEDEIGDAYDNWLRSNVDMGWSIEDEVSE